jgi:hypothetical protein
MAFRTNVGNHTADNYIAALIIMAGAGFYVYDQNYDQLILLYHFIFYFNPLVLILLFSTIFIKHIFFFSLPDFFLNLLC